MVKSSGDLLSWLPWWQGSQPADLSAALTPSPPGRLPSGEQVVLCLLGSQGLPASLSHLTGARASSERAPARAAVVARGFTGAAAGSSVWQVS